MLSLICFHETQNLCFIPEISLRAGILPTEITVIYLGLVKSFSQVVEPMRWHHIVLSMQFGNATLYWNGLRIGSVLFDDSILKLNGYLVLGQEQDAPLANFVKEQMFQGMLSDFRLMKPVAADTVRRITFCSETGNDFTIVKWSELDWHYAGYVERGTNDICLHETHLRIIIPISVSFLQAKIECNLLNSTLYSPGSYNEMTDIVEFSASQQQCDNYYQNDRLYWVSMTYNENTKKWLTDDGRKATNGFEILNNPNKYDIIGLRGDRHDLVPVSSDTEACAICETKYPDYPYYLLGFCDSYVERVASFFIRNSEHGLSFYNYHGFVLHMVGNIWRLYHQDSNRTLAIYEGDGIPIGNKDWKMFVAIESCADFLEYFNTRSNKVFSEVESTVSLGFSNCPQEYYTCGDGDCILMKDVCSHTTECFDGGDEVSCHPIKVRPNYNKDFAPSQYPFKLKVGPIIEQVRI